MLQRKNGATLAEIMDKMSWQKHTVRGFMAGAMKKAGYNVESFKPGRSLAGPIRHRKHAPALLYTVRFQGPKWKSWYNSLK
jgi:Protein of unknown function (DUF3489)